MLGSASVNLEIASPQWTGEGWAGLLSPQQGLLFLKHLLQEGGKNSSSSGPYPAQVILEPQWQVQDPSRAGAGQGAEAQPRDI